MTDDVNPFRFGALALDDAFTDRKEEIAELKADDRVPEWATSLLARHDCQLNRISKYCAGVAQLHNLKVLPLALSPGVPVPLEPGEGEPNLSVSPSSGPISEPPHG